MTTHKGICLLPTLVLFLGVLFNVAARHLNKRASAALGSPLGCRILTANNFQHQLGGKLARISQSNRIGSANVEPTWPIMKAIDQLVGTIAAGLYLQCQPALIAVPDQVRL